MTDAVVLPLRERGQLAFPAEIAGWRRRPPCDAVLPGHVLCWSRSNAAPSPCVHIVALTGPLMRDEEVLVACCLHEPADIEDAVRITPIRFGDSLRLGKWLPTEATPDVAVALIGSACEVLLTASGLSTAAENLDNLMEVAAHGMFGPAQAAAGCVMKARR